MEICNSFELVVTTVDGRAVLDKEYFTEKEEQCELNTKSLNFPLKTECSHKHCFLTVQCFIVTVLVVRQVFSNMEFLGWYTIGDTPSEEDAHFHDQLCSDRENSLLLKLNTSARTNQVRLIPYTATL